MRCFRLLLAYDGSGFHGWQTQLGQRTVQGEVEDALAIICQERVPLAAAGRTDAGVHALGQVASFRLDSALDPGKILASLRSLLPYDISVRELHLAHESFHARFSATGRFYLYRIGLEALAPFRGIRWEPRWPLDVERMQKALAYLENATDFRSFCRSESADKGTTCHLKELSLEERNGELQLRIGADRFLHNMVRIIAGTLVEIGRGRWEAEKMGEILESRSRQEAGDTAPPQGLYLMRVEYPKELLTP
ncbi:MAG: tRNA pseudouridine(38-40) synthase TruA [Candidatus Krumholzibacteria bacterium]|nr:tRNA pseudouridine(38-40) synthase TruA [Candidatus Krumholzibacteria bacterium]MDP6669194.1 tRNA pseudouridine(38-40) synthase TruA [Candidatus Krumholzibacteria bacterium]MDP6797672.1 tRNA pseudouridine(38-40) synthase TruA [Candidatus Krumholzibacteria bacterium]MDP7021246.1 tRNA pseudouridine(38-40) synthase TruA [Candidatus Krumholzibacteria bacterium]